MKISVGKVVKAQGLKGEVKVLSYLDNAEMLKCFKYMYLKDVKKEIVSIRSQNEYAFIIFRNITDRNSADLIKDIELFADREQLHLPSDRLLICDLLGGEVSLSDGQYVGKISDIIHIKGVADVLEIIGEKKVMLPFVKGLLISIDTEFKRIIFDSKRFYEVSIYED
ncbi:MAG: ribosome maturation factor RimM [Clostridia bacterium]